MTTQNTKNPPESELAAAVGSAKIIQILTTPNDALWQGRLLGLGDDGATYQCGASKWELIIEPLTARHNAKINQEDPSHE